MFDCSLEYFLVSPAPSDRTHCAEDGVHVYYIVYRARDVYNDDIV